MDKKSIVLLIISGIILCIAIVFAIWSFNVDLSIAQNNNVSNSEESTKNTVEQENKNTQEESETQDFTATYTDFTLEDLEGNEIKLSDHKDRPVVVLFWSSENQDSVTMLNKINEQYDTYKENISFIAIKAEEIDEDLGEIKVPIYVDKNQEVMKIYNVTDLPTILYITKENEIFNAKTGLTTDDALKANMDILSENY